MFLSYFFMSIMFPTIFALGIFGLGGRAKQASAYIVMAIMGGAIAPKIMGYIADHTNLSIGFIVPALCFAFVGFYGFLWPKLAQAEGVRGLKVERLALISHRHADRFAPSFLEVRPGRVRLDRAGHAPCCSGISCRSTWKRKPRAAGIDGVVSVQARQSVEETAWLLELARDSRVDQGRGRLGAAGFARRGRATWSVSPPNRS